MGVLQNCGIVTAVEAVAEMIANGFGRGRGPVATARFLDWVVDPTVGKLLNHSQCESPAAVEDPLPVVSASRRRVPHREVPILPIAV